MKSSQYTLSTTMIKLIHLITKLQKVLLQNFSKTKSFLNKINRYCEVEQSD